MAAIEIPKALLPKDGRFNSGPSKVRSEGIDALVAVAPTYLGTSHRQAGVRDVVARVRRGIAELFSLPDGYEVVLGNGGSTAFWDIATFCLIESRSQHCSFGEFSSKFAAAAKAAPHLADPEVLSSEPGTHPDPLANPGKDHRVVAHHVTPAHRVHADLLRRALAHDASTAMPRHFVELLFAHRSQNLSQGLRRAARGVALQAMVHLHDFQIEPRPQNLRRLARQPEQGVHPGGEV